MSKPSPLTALIIDLQKAPTMKLRKINIAQTAEKRGLPVEWVRHYVNVELNAR